MGFSLLIHLHERVIPRELYNWLMTRLSLDSKVLVAADGREFVLSPVQVQCVLGIPRDDMHVLTELRDNNEDNLMSGDV